MRAIDLDYQRPRGKRLGLALFAAGCLAAAGASLAAWQQAQAVATLEERLARLERQRPAAPGGERTDPALERGLREARAVETALDRHWGELFQAIESAQGADVALLSIEPDADKGLVLIGAEARQREAMLGYLQRLGKTPVLRDAVLVEHRVQRQVAERPIRFSLSATWEPSP